MNKFLSNFQGRKFAGFVIFCAVIIGSSSFLSLDHFKVLCNTILMGFVTLAGGNILAKGVYSVTNKFKGKENENAPTNSLEISEK